MMEKEALAMVYALHRFYYYFFNNKFVFNVDHMALTYLVNKPQLSGIKQGGYYCFWTMTIPSYP
jgi:hypothetical protein